MELEAVIPSVLRHVEDPFDMPMALNIIEGLISSRSVSKVDQQSVNRLI